MTKRFSILVLAIVGLAACGGGGGGGGDFAALYEAPTGESTDSLYGVWGGFFETNDTRWVLHSDEVTIANKCGNTIVGVVVAAEVDDTQIRLLESADDGGESCFVHAAPATFAACPPDVLSHDTCFVRDGEQMWMYDSDISYIELTKLQD